MVEFNDWTRRAETWDGGLGTTFGTAWRLMGDQNHNSNEHGVLEAFFCGG